MGCLPVIVLFLLGTGAGFALGAREGALWGAGLGLLLGMLGTVALTLVLRGRRR